MFVATGLPYRNHTQYSYAKLDGVCDDRFYNRVAELSSSTCRFLCDTAWRRPCYGYTYYVIPPHEADLGTTMSECKFLTETCSPTRRKRKASVNSSLKPVAPLAGNERRSPTSANSRQFPVLRSI